MPSSEVSRETLGREKAGQTKRSGKWQRVQNRAVFGLLSPHLRHVTFIAGLRSIRPRAGIRERPELGVLLDQLDDLAAGGQWFGIRASSGGRDSFGLQRLTTPRRIAKSGVATRKSGVATR